MDQMYRMDLLDRMDQMNWIVILKLQPMGRR